MTHNNRGKRRANDAQAIVDAQLLREMTKCFK